jgi:hypothetical protein
LSSGVERHTRWEPSSYEEKVLKAIEEQELSQAEKFSYRATLPRKISEVG